MINERCAEARRILWQRMNAEQREDFVRQATSLILAGWSTERLERWAQKPYAFGHQLTPAEAHTVMRQWMIEFKAMLSMFYKLGEERPLTDEEWYQLRQKPSIREAVHGIILYET